jgi:prepilin-type N-terminal cleavage/methylation domain-containing protein/prepilin-type processing-associated H-X9-DG protein
MLHIPEDVRNQRKKSAFTLVELLVVITIIGILIALLLPAVQAAREAARRMQCTNNLKQFGLGMANYESAYQAYPMGVFWSVPDGSVGARNGWIVTLLPYVEMASLYDALDLFPKTGWSANNGVNDKVYTTQVPVFQCPSDDRTTFPSNGYNLSRSNYVGCFSLTNTIVEKAAYPKYCNADPSAASLPARPRTIFNWNNSRTVADVRDGTSNTVAISEVIAGREGDLRGAWWEEWGYSYSHARTPNTSTPDTMWNVVMSYGCCVSTTESPCDGNGGSYWGSEIFAARSRHSGGVNACLLDGSARFFSDQISLTTWQALGSIDGDETIKGGD